MSKKAFILPILLIVISSIAIVIGLGDQSIHRDHYDGTCNISVPYFRQETNYTCGPACLRMILSFHGINQTEDDLVTLSNCTTKGTYIKKLTSAANHFNIHANYTKNSNLSHIKQEINTGRPIIVLIKPKYIYEDNKQNHSHYIVIMDIKNDKIIYNDPGIRNGKLLYCEEEAFIKGWSVENNRTISFKK